MTKPHMSHLARRIERGVIRIPPSLMQSELKFERAYLLPKLDDLEWLARIADVAAISVPEVSFPVEESATVGYGDEPYVPLPVQVRLEAVQAWKSNPSRYRTGSASAARWEAAAPPTSGWSAWTAIVRQARALRTANETARKARMAAPKKDLIAWGFKLCRALPAYDVRVVWLPLCERYQELCAGVAP